MHVRPRRTCYMPVAMHRIVVQFRVIASVFYVFVRIGWLVYLIQCGRFIPHMHVCPRRTCYMQVVMHRIVVQFRVIASVFYVFVRIGWLVYLIQCGRFFF
ncbi:hypothetical protein F5887DRAFT_1006308 [Amanita rubescens]|nr:hypothetical protein F5887DRAFT_1006308 [Amanita rubescens]